METPAELAARLNEAAERIGERMAAILGYDTPDAMMAAADCLMPLPRCLRERRCPMYDEDGAVVGDLIEVPAETPDAVNSQDPCGCDPADVAPVLDINWEE